MIKKIRNLFRRFKNRIREEKLFFYEKKKIFLYFFLKPDYVLMMTPLHGNIGDQAIAISIVDWIKRRDMKARILEVSNIGMDKHKWLYKCVLRRWRGKITILITGGGFMGNLWTEEERRVLNLLKEYPDIKIVILPQTIYFDINSVNGKRQRDYSRKTYNNHNRLTVCCREHRSYLWMKQNCPNVICVEIPDMVLRMSYEGCFDKRKYIFFCMRKDCEKIVSRDFLLHIKDIIYKIYPKENVFDIDTVNERELYFTQKKRKMALKKKLDEFLSAKLIITDRLHGMLFSVITGTPCIAIDNGSSKVSGVYEWIKDCKYVAFVTSVEEFSVALEQININQEYQYRNDNLLPYFNNLFHLIAE